MRRVEFPVGRLVSSARNEVIKIRRYNGLAVRVAPRGDGEGGRS
jgi:hypothetical protein